MEKFFISWKTSSQLNLISSFWNVAPLHVLTPSQLFQPTTVSTKAFSEVKCKKKQFPLFYLKRHISNSQVNKIWNLEDKDPHIARMCQRLQMSVKQQVVENMIKHYLLSLHLS